jgi:hypothetical protein
MEKKHAELTEILDDIGDRPLRRKDVERILPRINADLLEDGRIHRNCLECSLALDDALGRKASVAGPSEGGASPGAVRRLLDGKRSLDTKPLYFVDNLDSVKEELLGRSGARAIIGRDMDIGGGITSHAYNIANIDGEVVFLDAQVNKILNENSVKGYTNYTIFITA